MAAPKPIGPIKHINLKGMFLAWKGDQPAIIELVHENDKRICLPLFTSLEKLEAAMADVPYDKIKQVDDGPEFLTSIPGSVYVVIDLYRHENGMLRWVEVKRD